LSGQLENSSGGKAESPQDLESFPAKHWGEIDVLARNVKDISDLHSEMTNVALIVCKTIVAGDSVLKRIVTIQISCYFQVHLIG